MRDAIELKEPFTVEELAYRCLFEETETSSNSTVT